MIRFAKRNLMVFFRDKSAVFFSLLSALIIVALYALFLGDTMTQGYEAVPEVRALMDSWIVAGILAITSITTTMGAYGTMVDDRARKIEKDFHCSPLHKSSIAGGYILSAFLIGVVMTLVALVLGEVYIVATGGPWLSFAATLKVLGLILATCFMNTAMVFFVVSFFRSLNAFSTASTILGTMIGFVTGIYMPVGVLPVAIQYVVKVFPVTHSAVLLRQVMMEGPLATSFAGAPAQAVSEFNEMMGITMRCGDASVTPFASLLVILLTGLLFFLLSSVRMSRKKR